MGPIIPLIFIIAIRSCFSDRVAILVHGFNRGAEGWEKVVLGDVNNRELGRSSHAISVASKYLNMEDECIKCIYWGSGVKAVDDLLEGEYTLVKQLSEFDKLREFPEFADMSLETLHELKEYIKKVSITCCKSTNTVTEIKHAFELFEQLDIDHIILVSSPTHIPRCVRDAAAYLHNKFETETHNNLESMQNTNLNTTTTTTNHNNNRNALYPRWRPLLSASPASVCFPHTKMSDVVIIEPSHLPNLIKIETQLRKDSLTLHELCRKCLFIPLDQKSEFLHDFNILLKKYYS